MKIKTQLIATPDHAFSWNYYLKGDGHVCYWENQWTKEQGSLLIDQVLHEINKHGTTSGYWTMECDGEVIASAKKVSITKWNFWLDSPMGEIYLGYDGFPNRSHFVAQDGKVIATIRPKRRFSRHAIIETLVEDVDIKTLTLCFWLVIVCWKRDVG